MNEIDNWNSIYKKYKSILKNTKLINGKKYRAITCDGEIFDGIMTYHSQGKAELQNGSDFKSFNRENTKLHLISNP